MKHIQNKFLSQSVEFLKGIGEYRASVLKNEKGIRTVRDLLLEIPRDYLDRSRVYTIREAKQLNHSVQIKGKITHLKRIPGKRKRLQATFSDGDSSIQFNWFAKIDFIQKILKPNITYIAYGKMNEYNGFYNINHPELTPLSEHQKVSSGLLPIYSSTELLNKNKLDVKNRRKIMRRVLKKLMKYQIKETLPEWIISHYGLMQLSHAIHNIHFPHNLKELEKAKFRLKFEECFFDQLSQISRKVKNKINSQGFLFNKVGKNFNTFYSEHLPFELTSAQKRVVREIKDDMSSGHHMNRLIQGDVGSGKTMVALLAMLLSLDHGSQACIMAPTEVLARQHFAGISDYLKDMDVKVSFLSGTVTGKAREEVIRETKNGVVNILIGTHALIEDKVDFNKLGIAVIDEQHRFGVAQRASLWKKNDDIAPHILVMTATPIPRTLAMTLYGDLEVSVIDEMPPGRKDVKTFHVTDSSRMKVYDFIKQEIHKGRQAYVVYPLIEESEKLALVDLENGYRKMRSYFPHEKYKVSMVHGRMKPADKDIEMENFVKGNTDIMLATTVIEVGVNVPNATIMLIENVERFGLSQLHQLRGRVGRGGDQAYCLLMSGDTVSKEAQERIGIMVETTDGFIIADKDLQMRGPGNIAGTRQSGNLEFKVLDLNEDTELIAHLAKLCEKILREDPGLQHPDNKKLSYFMKTTGKTKKHWSEIS